MAVAYHGLAQLGLLFALPGSLASPIWPPTGFAIAAVALWRFPAALGVLLGAVSANYASSAPLAAAIALGAGNALEALAGGLLLARLGGAAAFRTVGRVGRFLGVAALAPLASAGIGIGALVATGVLLPAAAPQAAWTWYLGDVAGAVVVAPPLLLAAQARWPRASLRRAVEPAATGAVLLGLAAALFGLVPGVPGDWPGRLLLLMPPLVWIATRLSPAFATACLAAVDALAVAATKMGRGPFQVSEANTAFLQLQSFILTAAGITLTLGALRTERRRDAQDLEGLVANRTAELRDEVEERRRAEATLEAAQEIAHIGSWELDLATMRVTRSAEMRRIVGDGGRATVTLPAAMAAIHPGDRPRAEALLREVTAVGRPFSLDHRIVRPDGTVRSVHSQGRAFLGPDGRVLRVSGTAHDVTERQAHEERFAALLESAPDAMVIVDEAGRIVFVNGQVERLFGYGRDELLGGAVETLIPASARARHAGHRAAFAGSPGQRPMGEGLDLRGRRKDGTEFPVEVSLSPLHTAQGVLVSSAIRDVTERHQAEAALRASNEALAEAQRIAHLGSWALDAAAGTVTGSAEMFRLLGMPAPPGPLPFAALQARIDPAHLAPAQEALRRAIAENSRLSLDVPVLRDGGVPAWLHMEGRLDAAGRMVGTAQDVTQALRHEADLRESLERFTVLADGSPLGIFHTTVQGQVDYANPRWEEIAGCDHRDFAAIRAAVHPDDREPLTKAWRAAVASGTDLVAEFRYVHRDGKVVECWTRASPVRDASGKVTGFVGTVDDVSERRALEARQRELDLIREQARFKTEFLRTAAHELGNPLTPIKIQLRLLRDFVRQAPHAGARRNVEILDRNVERLHLLVRDMLESARLQSGRLRLLPRPMDLSHMVHEVAETFQEAAIEQGIALEVETPPGLPMVADPDRLTQVLYNLLSNAMKFTPAGGRIHVQVQRAGERASVLVQDTGAGFTADQAAGLFQPFGQVHDVVPGKGGTGLGLYISKGIVEQHGGRLEARSDGPGKGATFLFWVPLATAVAPEEGLAAADRLAGALQGKRST
ncbi:MAG: PAS domain S-box protein [Thermoplasmatota archaeon]